MWTPPRRAPRTVSSRTWQPLPASLQDDSGAPLCVLAESDAFSLDELTIARRLPPAPGPSLVLADEKPDRQGPAGIGRVHHLQVEVRCERTAGVADFGHRLPLDHRIAGSDANGALPEVRKEHEPSLALEEQIVARERLDVL